MFIDYLPYIVTIICAIISAWVSIHISRRGSKSNYENIVKEYGLKNKQYVSQVKFDAIFEIIRKLSASLGLMVGKTQIIFPEINAVQFTDEGMRNNYESAIDAQNNARNEYLQSAPFISKTLAEKVNNLIDRDHILLQSYYLMDCFLHSPNINERQEVSKIQSNCIEQTKLLVSDYEKLVDEFREYASSFDAQGE